MIYTINELSKKLNSGDVSNLYLLYGDEEYLKEFYRDAIVKEINSKEEYAEVIKISGSKSADEIYEAAETSSMFGMTKVLILKDTGWFKNDAKDSFEKYGFLTQIKDYLYVIFIEEGIAKNKKLYKETEKNGVCVELNAQSDDMREKWIAKQFSVNNINVNRDVCRYIVNNCEKDFSNLHNEIEKICLLKNPGDTITVKDVDEVCVKIINSKIFALTDAVSAKNTKQALKALNDLIYTGEPIERIFFMLCRYFKLMKQIKELVLEGNGQKAAGILKINPYEAGQFVKNSNKFSIDILKEAENDCVNFDVLRKNGGIDYKDSAEILIIKYCGR